MINNPYEEKLAEFLEDEVMYHAVRHALEAEFDANIQINAQTPNTTIMEQVRGILDGRARLVNGFKSLERYRRSKSQEDLRGDNPNGV